MPAQRTSKRPRVAVATGALLLITTLGLAACSSSGAPGLGASPGASSAPTPHATEVSPSGDIPDNQAYVPVTSPDGSFSVSVPEGWARSSSGSTTTFTDKLNMITILPEAVATAPTVASVKNAEVASLGASEPKFALTDVKSFTRAGGNGIVITFQSDSPVNQVTGSVVRNEVEKYLFWKGGKQVAITLTSPKGSDNVDPWAKVTGSFAWTQK